MNIIITQEQFDLLNETKKEKVSCSKCDHTWEIEKKDKHPHLCHMCGYDSKSKKHNYEELENFWKNYKKEEVTEKWSEKYKKSINCDSPKGFSQRAHCQGRKKHLKENFEDLTKFKKAIEKNLNQNKSNYEWLASIEADFTTTNTSSGWKNEYGAPLCMYTVNINGNRTPNPKEQRSLFDDISFVHSMYFPIENNKPTCYFSTRTQYPDGDTTSFPSLRTMNENTEESKLIGGIYDLEKIQKAINLMTKLSTSFGEYIPLKFKLYGYHMKENDGFKIMILYIDVDSQDGVYDTMSRIWYEIGQQLLEIFQMMGIRDEKYMYPSYDFKFNKRSLENITIL